MLLCSARNGARWIYPRGFTQVELSVTVLVIGILAAIAAPSLTQWLRHQQVNAAFNQIDLALQATQSEAVKRHQSCSVTVSQGINPSLRGNCLQTGDRTLEGMTLHHSRHDVDWTITFNSNGENRSPHNDPGMLWLSAPNVQSKCLVISVGIGLRRMGQFNGDTCVTP